MFCYTSWRFYAFSGSNLLTRCHSASSLFSAVFFCVSEKLHKKYSRSWTKQKLKFLFFPIRDGVQSRDRGGPEGGHPPTARATPWPHRGLLWAPGPPPDIALPPIYSPRQENPKYPINFSRKHTASRRCHQCEIGRVQKLFLAPCRRGESSPEVFFITMSAFGVMCE
jgi:hypothetical protein